MVGVQSLSGAQPFVTPWTTAHQASPSFTVSQSLLKLISVELMMPSNHLILCRPLLLLPSVFPSIRVFSNESALRIRWPKDWNFSLSISLSNEHSGVISFRMDWLDLLAVQGTLKSLLQHHSLKASILQHPAFFIRKPLGSIIERLQEAGYRELSAVPVLSSVHKEDASSLICVLLNASSEGLCRDLGGFEYNSFPRRVRNLLLQKSLENPVSCPTG